MSRGRGRQREGMLTSELITIVPISESLTVGPHLVRRGWAGPLRRGDVRLKPVNCEDGKEESQCFWAIEQGVQRPWGELRSPTVAEEQTTERGAEEAQERRKNTPGQELYTDNLRTWTPIEQTAAWPLCL